jgi:hypothetical protein
VKLTSLPHLVTRMEMFEAILLVTFPHSYCLHGVFLINPRNMWLRHYATNQKVAGSIPDEVNF